MELKNIENLLSQKRFVEAKEELIRLKKKGENYKNINFTLSQVCIQLNELENSKKYLENHLKNNAKDCEALLNLANLQLKTLEINKVEKIYKKILRIDKNYLPAITNLAFFYEGMGKIKDAKKYYEIARKLEPQNLNFYYNLIRLNSDYINDKEIKFIKEIIKEKKLPKKNEFLANLIISKNFEKKKDFTNEIKFLNLSQENFLNYNVNNMSLKYWLKIIPNLYDKFIFKNSSKKIFNQIYPLFIIGLPRSGSTITELILSSSKTPKYTIGESNLINRILVNNYGNKLFNNSENNKIDFDVNFIEEKIVLFLKNLNITSFDNKIFIDKSLENFFYLDLIIKVFPNAKFIITERNINDNVIGIYKKLLFDISWSHSISDIMEYVNNYKNIISYYKKKYPKRVFFIKLDDLQNSNKEKVEDLFKFCGLEFNKKCFEFQNIHQFVNNASNIQIRNNLKSYDEKKYENYFHLLEHFKDKYSWLKK